MSRGLRHVCRQRRGERHRGKPVGELQEGLKVRWGRWVERRKPAAGLDHSTGDASDRAWPACPCDASEAQLSPNCDTHPIGDARRCIRFSVKEGEPC